MHRNKASRHTRVVVVDHGHNIINPNRFFLQANKEWPEEKICASQEVPLEDGSRPEGLDRLVSATGCLTAQTVLSCWPS
eukprot:5403772-Karenia_brevis.AAC.1